MLKAGKESREIDQENELGGSATRSPSPCQVPILRLATLLLGTPISNRDFTIVLALESGYPSPMLSECNPTST